MMNKQMILLVTSMIATAIGSFGGFPKPPKIFMRLAKYELFKWLMMFILILQGGGGFDVKTSLLGTILVFVFYKVVVYMEKGTKQIKKNKIKV